MWRDGNRMTVVNMCMMYVLKYGLLVECRFTVFVCWYKIDCWLVGLTWWETQSSATLLFPWREQEVVWCNGSDAVADNCAFVLEGIVVIKHEWWNLELKFSSNMISSVRLQKKRKTFKSKDDHCCRSDLRTRSSRLHELHYTLLQINPTTLRNCKPVVWSLNKNARKVLFMSPLNPSKSCWKDVLGM